MKKFTAMLLAATWATASQAAVTYEMTNGKLTSIKGLAESPAYALGQYDVNGELYWQPHSEIIGLEWATVSDIEFMDGTCSIVFGSCSRYNQYAAMTRRVLNFLPVSLLSDAKIDGVSYNFSANPSLINGCDSKLSCTIGLGYVRDDSNQVAFNNVIVWSGDANGNAATLSLNDNTSLLQNATFARITSRTITRQVGAVPEPATWAMMLFGFAGIGFAMRRRSKVRTRVAYAV